MQYVSINEHEKIYYINEYIINHFIGQKILNDWHVYQKETIEAL